MIIKDCKKYCIRCPDDENNIDREVSLDYYYAKDFIINVIGGDVGSFYFVKNRYGVNHIGKYIKVNGFYFQMNRMLDFAQELVNKKDKPTLLLNMKHNNQCVAHLCRHLLGLYNDDFFIDTHTQR